MTPVTAMIVAQDYNPFNGVTPSFGPFSPLLTSKVGLLLGVAWAAAMVYAAYHLLEGIGRCASASRQGYADNLAEAKRALVMPIVAIIGLAAAPIIYGVLVSTG